MASRGAKKHSKAMEVDPLPSGYEELEVPEYIPTPDVDPVDLTPPSKRDRRQSPEPMGAPKKRILFGARKPKGDEDVMESKWMSLPQQVARADLSSSARKLLEYAMKSYNHQKQKFAEWVLPCSILFPTLAPYNRGDPPQHFGVIIETEADWAEWRLFFRDLFGPLVVGREDELIDVLESAKLNHWFKEASDETLYVRMGLPKRKIVEPNGAKRTDAILLPEGLNQRGTRVQVVARPGIYVEANMNGKRYSGVFMQAVEILPAQ